jgi:Zn-dependent peptidase ImmA (M78 family)
MKINDLVESQTKTPEFIKMMQDFLPFAVKELGLNDLPNFQLMLHLPHDQQPTFGKYVNDENTIYLGIEDRHPLDILRTLAHELVHYKQGTEHTLGPHSGDTGSDIENQAHEMAGIIMREFDKAHPAYFNASAVNIQEGAIEDLEKDLKHPYSYDAIDHMMTSIAKKYKISPKKLHDLFIDKHNKSPDDWIKK